MYYSNLKKRLNEWMNDWIESIEFNDDIHNGLVTAFVQCCAGTALYSIKYNHHRSLHRLLQVKWIFFHFILVCFGWLMTDKKDEKSIWRDNRQDLASLYNMREPVFHIYIYMRPLTTLQTDIPILENYLTKDSSIILLQPRHKSCLHWPMHQNEAINMKFLNKFHLFPSIVLWKFTRKRDSNSPYYGVCV